MRIKNKKLKEWFAAKIGMRKAMTGLSGVFSKKSWEKRVLMLLDKMDHDLPYRLVITGKESKHG